MSPNGPSELRSELHRQRALADLTTHALGGADIDEVLGRTCEIASDLLSAPAVGVFGLVPGEVELARLSGAGFDETSATTLRPRDVAGAADLLVPGAVRLSEATDGILREAGIRRGVSAVIRGVRKPFGVLVVGWTEEREVAMEDEAFIETLAGFLAAAIQRRRTEDDLREQRERLEEAQRMARMGSYDWNVVADTNVWSDELYRIYGTEPQSFNASYDRFLSFIHPDDRDKVKATHFEAYETGGTYQMEERIVRPNGEIRILDTFGEVVTDDQGKPLRMRGICRDITEQREAEHAITVANRRNEALLESSPDGVLLLDGDAVVVQVNAQACRLFATTDDDLVGRRFGELVPLAFADVAPPDETAGPAYSVGLDLEAVRPDGSTFAVDVHASDLDSGEGGLRACYVRDASERRHAADLELRLQEVALRREQALELNDNVVQGLTALVYSLEMGTGERALDAARATLAAARGMMDDILEQVHGDDLSPGRLVRNVAAGSVLGSPPAAPPAGESSSGLRVVVADDSEDMRTLVTFALGREADMDVVAEASDGAEAVRICSRERPDVLVLDLAMPGMDGLEALPMVKLESPDTRVLILSGFARSRMADQSRLAGADGYLEKGGPIAELVAAVREVAESVPA